nr:EcsC family protein [Caulobacter sp. FWC2]
MSPDLLAWRADLTKPAGPLNGLARAAQTRINRIIPEKVHAAITAAIEGMTRALLTGADFTFRFLLPLREKVARSAG